MWSSYYLLKVFYYIYKYKLIFDANLVKKNTLFHALRLKKFAISCKFSSLDFFLIPHIIYYAKSWVQRTLIPIFDLHFKSILKKKNFIENKMLFLGGFSYRN